MLRRALRVAIITLHPLPGISDWAQLAISGMLILGGGAVGSLIERAISGVFGVGALTGFLVTALLLVFWAAYRLQERVDEREREPRPNLQPLKPCVELVGLYTTDGQPRAGFDVARAVVKNDPGQREESATARSVIIKLAFHSGVDDALIMGEEFYGRWTQNEQPGTRKRFAPIDDIRRRDLVPNGEPNEIDLVLKYPNDSACYAFNDETCRDIPDWRDPKLRLEGRYLKVVVTLQGIRVGTWQQSVYVENLGPGQRLRVSDQPFILSARDKEESRPPRV